MSNDPYKQLAQRLDALPNGFPPTADGVELRLLAKLFTPQEAALAAHLRLTMQPAEQIASQTGGDAQTIREQLKSMARRGLIEIGKVEGELRFGLLPFAVGIYENQVATMDAELAQLFEDYYKQVFAKVLLVQPTVHRVIPIAESVRTDMEIRPYESAKEIVTSAAAWGVQDCICRRQKALIGDPCDHPVDICMVFSSRPGVFDHHPVVRSQTLEQSLATLRRAAEAGLVHTVSNNQQGVWYICNCCTCSCGILRGIAELGLPNAVARSAFVCQVEEDQCTACQLCAESCQFDALSVDEVARVDPARCEGCGVCTESCPDKALILVRRPEEEVLVPPLTKQDWMKERAATRGLDLGEVL